MNSGTLVVSDGSFQSYSVIRSTWLSRKLDNQAAQVAFWTTFVMWLASFMFWGNSWAAADWMSATATQVFTQHQWWRAWTTLFVHADLRHLLSNSLLFFILGIFLSGYFGAWIFPFATVLFGGIVNLFVLRAMPAASELIGMSGAVFWMGGFWLVLYFFLDRRKTGIQRALRAFGVALLLFGPGEVFDPSISYRAHFLGFAFGVVSGGIYYWWKRREFLASEVHETIFEEIDSATPV